MGGVDIGMILSGHGLVEMVRSNDRLMTSGVSLMGFLDARKRGMTLTRFWRTLGDDPQVFFFLVRESQTRAAGPTEVTPQDEE